MNRESQPGPMLAQGTQQALPDPSWVESQVLTEEQVGRIRQLLARASGAIVLDDHADGHGAVVATLSNGRHLISLEVPLGSKIDPAAEEANAELFGHARAIIARLLRDRELILQENARLRRQVEELSALVREQLRQSTSVSAAHPR